MAVTRLSFHWSEASCCMMERVDLSNSASVMVSESPGGVCSETNSNSTSPSLGMSSPRMLPGGTSAPSRATFLNMVTSFEPSYRSLSAARMAWFSGFSMSSR